MRYRVLQAVRQGGLLNIWDQFSFAREKARTARINREFLRANPGYAQPPATLAFDAYNTINLKAYAEIGRRQAEGFAAFMKEHWPAQDDGPRRVLEWGCGPARLIRHMPELLEQLDVEVEGTDYNEATIAWCRDNFPGITFTLNGLNPPLPFDEGRFTASYNFSVVTHLSEEVQMSWASELYRVLRPGGILLMTTHGKNFEHLLTERRELARYNDGEVVIQSKYEEGKKWFLAIHPEAFVKQRLLREFSEVHKLDGAPWAITQDVWLARK